MKEMQNNWKEFYLANKQTQVPTPPPPTPQPTYNPPPQEPIYTATEVVDDGFEDEVDEMQEFENSLKVNNIVEEMVNPQPKQSKRGRPKKIK